MCLTPMKEKNSEMKGDREGRPFRFLMRVSNVLPLGRFIQVEMPHVELLPLQLNPSTTFPPLYLLDIFRELS